jgi:GNAT superfamily N-acetyltransferase
VGYILSVADTSAFVSWWRTTYLPYCRDQGLEPPDLKNGKPPSWDEDLDGALRTLLYDPEDMLHRDHPKLLEDYPAHLHVDILPDWQGRGWGRRLMETLAGTLCGQGVRGVHLSMAGDNAAAGKFYEKMGFQRFGEVMDGGKSGEVGKEIGASIVYCRRLL